MKIAALLKATCSCLLILSTVNATAQDSIKILEELPGNAEKLEVVLPRTIWLNKSKVKIGDYGLAKIKEGITETGTTRNKGVTYSETKFKFSIVLTNADGKSSSLKARTVKNDEYVIASNSFLNNLSDVLDLGIESESISSMVFFPKTLKADITSDLENSKTWNFVLITTDQNNMLNTEIGRLTDGERTIHVIQTDLNSLRNLDQNGEITERTLFYEFLENGISLGAVTYDDENSMWLKPGLDPATKLILCTAMLSIAY